jgi:hypothetical protein
LSAGADGLLKLWALKDSTCMNTMDAHADKVWALAVRGDGGEVVTGGGDSVLKTWEDCTESVEEDEVRVAEERLLKEEALRTAARNKDFYKVCDMESYVCVCEEVLSREYTMLCILLCAVWHPFPHNGTGVLVELCLLPCTTCSHRAGSRLCP